MNRKILLVASMILIAILKSYADPVSLNIGKDTTICSGNCLTLQSNIPGIYLWSTGDTTASIKVCPSNTTVISLKVVSGGYIYSDAIKITVDKKGVYPGDADDDGIVNGRDVLYLGLAYGASGSPRVSPSNNWNAQHAENWSKYFKGGVNYKYADCNGDGSIDSNDITAIHDNWSETHSKTASDTVCIPGNPQLYMVANTDTFYPGENVQYRIFLGTASNHANNIYGVNFTYQFTTGSIQPGSMQLTVNPSNCWLYGSTGPTSVIPFLQADYSNDNASIAITRTTTPSVSGYGEIGVLSISINDNVGGKRAANMPITYGFTNVNAIDADGSDIALTTENKPIYMQNTLGIKAATHMAVPVDVYPNPVIGNSFEIDLHSLKADQISIVDMVGNTAYQAIKPMTGLNQIQLPNLSSGMYVLKISTQQGMVTRKININH